jgi:glycosyltransferase involved in cell wall biosynthesis
MTTNRKVSAVIPTRNRPALVCRAVRSVLAQTYQEIEVVIVVDGPDPDTVAALAEFVDPRVRVIALDENVGGSEARNIGAREAAGGWIALLDDDDEWLPGKIEKQIALAETFSGPRIMVACQYFDRMEDAELVRPRNFPKPGENICDFLYKRVSWLGAMDGFPQTSTWFLSREFFLEAPFRKGLKRNQDIDWLLQALRLPDIDLAIVPEPLVVFYNEKQRKRVTSAAGNGWQINRDWAVEHRELFTPQGFSTYIAILPLNMAMQDKVQWKSLKSLFQDCRQYGAISPKILWLFALYGIFYPYLRKVITPGLRKKLVYYAYMANHLRRFLRPSGKNSGEQLSARVL